MAAGITEIVVRKKPRVAIIPTGEELRDPTEEELKPGEIVDFNSQMISNYIKQWGGQPVVYGVVRDLEEELKGTVISAVGKEDIILIIAGTSAGQRILRHGVKGIGRGALSWYNYNAWEAYYCRSGL